MTDGMAVRPVLRGLALCAGVGGIDLGLHIAFGGRYRTVCFVEREAHAAAVLVARMEDASLAPALVWSDLTTFDGSEWCGLVDIVTAGYPCQPFSHAGKRGGAADPRHLWPHVARIIEECAAPAVLLENVPGHLSLGFDLVTEDLRRLGFRIAAGLFSAAEVGAPQRRERLFALAHRYSERHDRSRAQGHLGQSQPVAPSSSEPMAHTDSDLGCTDSGRSDTGADGRDDARGRSEAMADTDCGRAGCNGAGHGSAHQPDSRGCREVGDVGGTCCSRPQGGERAGALQEAGGGRAHMDQLPNQVAYAWPTPRASEAEHSGPNSRDSSGSLHLSSTACRVADMSVPCGPPDPTTAQHGPESGPTNQPWSQQSLVGHIGIWLSPRSGALSEALRQVATGASVDAAPPALQRALREQCSARARLNPLFVEWLMGWPRGWTGFEPVGTEWSRWEQRMQHEFSHMS